MLPRKIFWIGYLLVCLSAPLSAVMPTDRADGIFSTPPAQPDAPEPSYGPANEQGQYRYLIRFTEPGILHAVAGPANDRRPASDSGTRFNAHSSEARAHRDLLITRQAGHRQSMEQGLNRALDVTHRYLMSRSGLAAWLTPEEAMLIAALPQVVSVEQERLYHVATYLSPWVLGADTLWDGTGVPGGLDGLRGEGMVLGILDTGIDPAHPSFANDPACGHGEADTPDKVLSIIDCRGTDPDGMCGSGPNPIDVHGHGSHVAATAVGNRLDSTTEPPPQPPGEYTEISGMAPCAHVRSYMVCGQNGQCFTSAILAAIENVLLDGDVDALNFSISGGTNPWNDNDRAKLELVGTDVLVAAGAGNTGNIPSAGRVNHRAPWVLSVGASYHPYYFSWSRLSVSAPGEPDESLLDMPIRLIFDSPLAPPLADFPIRHFDAQPAEFEGCTPGEDDGSGQAAPPDMAPFPDEFFAGAAALIRRGGCGMATKIANAHQAGAELVVIVRSGPSSPSTGQPGITAYTIGPDEGLALLAFVNSHPGTARIDFDPYPGDEVAYFSMRGPTPGPLQNLTKPDLVAPGMAVYSARPVAVAPEGYDMAAGTSMAAPHVAGAALLLRQAHPDWSVPEVMSAMMTTARRDGFKGIQNTGYGFMNPEPWDEPWNADEAGSGRLDVAAAVRAGLVLHETYDHYLAADPDTGGDVRSLNTASLRDMNCEVSCSWTRTLRNTLGTPTQWEGFAGAHGETPAFEITVEPETFQFTGDPTETVELTITVTPMQDNLNGMARFGEVVFSETGGQSPDQHLTVAIRGRPEQPVAGLDPAPLHVTLSVETGATGTVAIANKGETPLEWALTEEADTSFQLPVSDIPHPATTGADCDEDPGLMINDTGFVDQGHGMMLDEADEVMYMDRYTTPHRLPARLKGACFVFQKRFSPSLPPSKDFEIVIYDTDGPDGAPGTELAALPVTFEGLKTHNFRPDWRSFDLESTGITVDKGSIYIGARWVPVPPGQHLNTWLGGDGTGTGYNIPSNPRGNGGGWRWTAPTGEWERLQDIHSNYHALFIRPVIEPPELDCTLPDWLTPGTTSGVVEPDDEQDLELLIDTADLEPGTYYASVCLNTADPNQAFLVLPVVLKVFDPNRIFRDRFEPVTNG